MSKPAPSLMCLLALVGACVASPAVAAAAGPVDPARPAIAPTSATQPIADLYTMGPGDDPFSKFGHAALCITDEQSPTGRCYNFGTADFSTPLPLTWRFLRGRALFWVSVQDLPRMLLSYVRQDRTVYRQRLPLPPQQARALADALFASSAEQVKYYRYHHFRDNCTTRLRDLLDAVTAPAPGQAGLLRRGDAEVHRGPTFRAYARAGLAGDPPLLVVTDLVLGRPADERTSLWQAMFLPAVLRSQVARLLNAPPAIVYQRRAPLPCPEIDPPLARAANPPATVFILGGVVLLVLIIVCGSLSLRTRSPDATEGPSPAPEVPALARPAQTRLPLRLALLATGLSLGLPGAIIAAVALLSPLAELRENEVLCVLWATDLLLPALRPRWLRRYLDLRLLCLGLVALLSLTGLLIQPLFPLLCLAALPLLAARLVLASSTGPASPD